MNLTRNWKQEGCALPDMPMIAFAVGSSAAANRVMHTITKWIEQKLGLKVNAAKTKVRKPSKLKYLGYGFVKMGDKWEARPHQDSVKAFERKLKKLTKRSWSVSMDERI